MFLQKLELTNLGNSILEIIYVLIGLLCSSSILLYGYYKANRDGFSIEEFEKMKLGFNYSIFNWLSFILTIIFIVVPIKDYIVEKYILGDDIFSSIIELIIFILIYILFQLFQKYIIRLIFKKLFVST